jgi:acyl-CoA thioesterase FadM
MIFEHRLRVLFQHCDPAGIAFFGRLFEYSHEAFEELLRARGTPLDEVIRSGAGAPLVHAEADFFRPLRHGMLVRVQLYRGKLSERSLRLDALLCDEAGALCARVAQVHAGLDLRSGRGAPLPRALAEALESLDPTPAA